MICKCSPLRQCVIVITFFTLFFSVSVKDGFGWYEDSYLHTHISLNLPVEHLEFIKKQIEIVKPDAIQFHTHDLRLIKKVKEKNIDQKLGFKVVATINYAGSWYPWYDEDDKYIYRINSDGTFAGRWTRKHLCFNTPVVYDEIIPEKYIGIPESTRPDQVWIDESIITVNICYCDNCITKYKKEYGKEPPRKLTNENFSKWEHWVKFHRDTFVDWMKSVVDAIHEVDPDILVTINHAYFVEQPEKLPDFIKNLSGDIHKDHLELGLYAKYASSINVPFDLMPGLGSDIWAGVEPKNIERIYNEISIISAYGGRWNIGEFPTDFLSLRNEEKYQGPGYRRADIYLNLAEKGAKFARRRKPFCMNTISDSSVAILHSARTHYSHVIFNTNNINENADLGMTSDGIIKRSDTGRINSRIYWPNNNPIVDDLVGAYEALVENHLQFDLMPSYYLRNNIDKYKLIILAEQAYLEDETIEAIKDFVHGGGAVIASGTTIKSGLDEILGAKYSPEKVIKYVKFMLGKEKISIENYMPVDITDAKVIKTTTNSNYPLVISNSYGKGNTVYIAGDIFKNYHRRSGYSYKPKGNSEILRKFINQQIKSVLPKSDKELKVIAQPWFEVVLRKDSEFKYIHIVNRRSNWKQKLEPDKAIKLLLPLESKPSTVKIQPDGDDCKFNYQNGNLEISLNPSDINFHKIIQIKQP